MPEHEVKCPYCGRAAEFRESSASIYHRKDYGPIYICEPCQAWFGCHPGTHNPLGRLANADLRRAKMAAHAAFDPTWRRLGFSRATAYKYLAEALGIHPGQCHIGMFDIEMCMRGVEVSTKERIAERIEDAEASHGCVKTAKSAGLPISPSNPRTTLRRSHDIRGTETANRR